ncbi:PH domain-containing protein [Candidatus Peregrinibacteria bacterium]|nr:PH domain-containing protein [Candidatus Peregrinibacteria bacterium]
MFGSRLFLRHLDDDEELVRIVHKHWLVGLRELFWPFVSLAASWAFYASAQYPTVLYAAAFWSVFGLVWLLRNFNDYYLDAWIITDQGVIDVAWHGWFHRQSSRVLYSDIQGVSYEIVGILGTVLQFGTISIEKISTGSMLSLDYVKRPRSVEKTILRQMEGYLHGKNLTDAKHVQELLAQIVAREMQMDGLPEGEEDSEDPEDSDDSDDSVDSDDE